MSDKLIRMFSTWFYIGDFPGAPGTAASAAATLMAVIFAPSAFVYIVVTIVVIILGFKVSGKMEELMGRKDPGCIVIDEVAGVMITFFLLPLTPATVLTGFFLFRAFDMFKIYPANKFESLGGATGVMADDLVAGVYANIVMQIAVRWAGVI